jgi:hypothetical protein
MAKWTFSPYNLKIWNSSNSRVMIVATEPNGNNPNSGNLDMGDWFRTANHTNNLHNNKLFHNRCKMILNGVFENEDDSNFNHFRFVDLKATSGGAQSNEQEIKNYIDNHFDEVMKFFISKDEEFGLHPHVVVLVGNSTYNIFSKYIQPELIKNKSQIFWICMPHPSAQTVANEPLKNACYEINQKLKPISEKPNKWFCKGKKDFGWREV